MENNFMYENVYTKAKKDIFNLKASNSLNYENISKIINLLSFDSNITIYLRNNFNLKEISKLLRFYEDILTNSFSENKSLFKIQFKSYVLIIELFIELCNLFSKDKEKRVLLDSIFQLLKESKNMVKMFIPLENSDIKVLNNYIGRQLYHYSHMQYISTKDKKLDYIFQEYYLNMEKILHGFELSVETNFADCKKTKEIDEKMIFINNLSFLLLKMIHKLEYYNPSIEYFDNSYFQNILYFFRKLSIKHQKTPILGIKEFENILIEEFKNSSNFLQENLNINMFDEKVKLLKLNTDEYKQLIDIIIALKQ